MIRLRAQTWLIALLGPLALLLCGFTTITTDPAKAEVVTTDVAHFWKAFDDAAKAPPAQRAEIYRKEYFDRASQGLKDFDVQRHVTPESLSAHVEQHRAEYVKLRPYINEVVDQKPVIQTALTLGFASSPQPTRASFPRSALHRLSTTGSMLLDRWTRHCAVGAEHATVAAQRFQQGMAVGAFEEKLTRINRHAFGLLELAFRTGQR